MIEKNLSEKQKQAIILKQANGPLSVLAIGIDAYDKQSGFPVLKTCSNDAIEVRNAFQEVWQLNADKGRVNSLTSKSNPPPSRGEIIKAVNSLVSMAEPGERLLFYYSGHGHRLKDKEGIERFYIIPQDAYSDTDPEALIDVVYILNLLNASEAKQRILVIDACMSGPDVTGKKLLPAKYSAKFLAEYMRNTKGVAIISSSAPDQSSTTQSPNPSLSLFTCYFIRALRGGEPNALDDSMLLTLNSLYDYISTEVQRRAKSYQKKQLPCIDVQASGVIILGDFGQSIVSPEAFDLEGYPISAVEFDDSEKINVRDILSNIKNWSAYTEEYLEKRVNDNLGEYVEEGLGVKVSNLRKNIGFSTSEVGVDGKNIRFPGGIYTVEYVADDKKYGKLLFSLSLNSEWFGRASDISAIVDSLNMFPDYMVLKLKKSIEPESVLSGLEAKGWEIQSQLPRKIVAKSSPYTLIVEDLQITLKGFLPSELFGDKVDKAKTTIASSILTLIASKV